MSKTAEELKPQLGSLSEEDRVELAHFLLESLDDPKEENLLMEELNRRAAAIRNGTAQGEPADQVFTELRKKYA